MTTVITLQKTVKLISFAKHVYCQVLLGSNAHCSQQ